jgi:hypothetical protein
MPRPHEPLPLEARKVLWKKVWDRLLAAPADVGASPIQGRGGNPGDPMAEPGAEREA